MKVTLTFTKPGYIANPYWPEMYRLIEIQKKSGMNRCRSDKKSREALESYLRGLEMTLKEYDELRVLAARPFHVNGDGSSIIIPSEKFASCMANANQEAPSKLRIDNLRGALIFSDLHTGKAAPDGKWERFAVVKSGTGKTLSNQRGFRSSEYIEHFTATGKIDHDETQVRPEDIVSLLTYAGRSIGIGASRKMGWGRFTVKEK